MNVENQIYSFHSEHLIWLSNFLNSISNHTTLICLQNIF